MLKLFCSPVDGNIELLNVFDMFSLLILLLRVETLIYKLTIFECDDIHPVLSDLRKS